MVVLPPAKIGKLPLVKATVEAVNVALLAQFVVVVSQVPLVGVDAPMLSHPLQGLRTGVIRQEEEHEAQGCGDDSE